MKMLENIWIFFTKNKKNIAYTFFFLILFFFFNDFAFAADEPKKPNWVIDLVNWVLAISASLIGVLTMLIWLFLRPEWTSGSVIWLDVQLKTIWILISNVVYFVFAWIFITIAFMNIVWWWDNYELKKAIPKFIIWVLIVPFSWFFVQFILSLSSILTVAVLSLPFDTFPEMKDNKMSLCDKNDGYSINLSASWVTNIISCKWNKDKKEITIWDFIKDNGGLYSIMTIYTYWVMKLSDKGLIDSIDITKWIKTLWWLSLKWIFDILFLIVYWLLMIALFLAFMTRWFALWFYAMFSPVFWLLYYLWKWKEWIGSEASKNFNLHEFIALAFVPVYVSAALSFWLLFLLTAWNWFALKSSDANAIIKFTGDSLSIWNNTFTTDHVVSVSKPPTWTSGFDGFAGPIWAMVLELLWLAVMWMAVMTALHSSKITWNVTEPIAQFGTDIWKLLAKAPTYAPILPGGMSATWLASAWSSFSSSVQNEFSGKWNKLWNDIAKQFWFWNQALSDIQGILNTTYRDAISTQKWMIELLWKIDETQLWDSSYRKVLWDAFKHLGATETLTKQIQTEASNKEMLSKVLDQSWEKAWWTDWESWAGKIFIWKDQNTISSMIWKGWTSSSSNSATSSNRVVKDNEKSKKDWDQIFNIYWLDSKWEVDMKKIEHKITVDKNWNTNINDAVTALKNFKDTKWKDWIKEILKGMWIIDEKEIEKILNEIFKP